MTNAPLAHLQAAGGRRRPREPKPGGAGPGRPRAGPALFIIMLESLLQWVAMGAGYQPHGAPGTPADDLPEKATDAAFVDDLLLFSASIDSMTAHLRKLEAFCEWSGMAVSMPKTMSTCLEYGGGSNARERMESALRINGEPIHFLTSHETYKYLGVHFRMDLSGTDHCAAMRATLVKHVKQLQDSALYGRDVWHLAQTVLFPKACYAFAMGLYTEHHVTQLQTTLLACIKHALRLHKSTQNAMLTLQIEQNGVGAPDLVAQYCEDASEGLKGALRDTGRLGRLTRQVFLAHTHAAGGDASKLTTRAAAQQSLICRRLALLSRHGILPENMTPTLDDLRDGEFVLRQTQAQSTPIDSEDSDEEPAVNAQPAAAPPIDTHRAAIDAALGLRRDFIHEAQAECYEQEEFTHLRRVHAVRTYKGKHGVQLQHLCEWGDSTVLKSNLKASPHLDRAVAHREPVLPTRCPRAAAGGRKTWQRTNGDPPRLLCRNLPPHLRAATAQQLLAAATRPSDALRVRWKLHWCHLTPNLQRTYARALADFHDNPQQLSSPPIRHVAQPWPTSVPSVTIVTDECNPDLDIVAPGAACVSADGSDALFHDAAGRFRGRTSAANARDLWQRFRAAQPGCTIPQFCARMIQLLRLHTAPARRRSDHTSHQLKAKHQHSLPSQLVAALRDSFNIGSEMFASPLNVHPGMQRFWTPTQSDTDFAGAQHDAFSAPWTGSALVHPEFEDASLAKAAKHAIAAAHGEEPCLFVFVAPRWHTKAFHRALVHSNKARLLFAAPAKTLQTTHHQHGAVSAETRTYTWPIDAWLISNDAGMMEHYDDTKLPALQAAIAAACSPGAPGVAATAPPPRASIYLSWLASELTDPTQPAPHLPHRVRRHTSPTPSATSAFNPGDAPPLADLAPLHSRQPAFTHAADVIYTDGSLKKGSPACGCGAYRASQPGYSASFHFSGEQTIMRAELSAISYALSSVPLTESITIATDSLSSLQAIRKTLNRPHRVADHRHEHLLRKIARQLQARNTAGSTTRLCKVRAHTGIVGNEAADKLAKAAVEDNCSAPEVSNPREAVHRFAWATTDDAGRAVPLADGKQVRAAAVAARNARIRTTEPATVAAKWMAAVAADGLLPAASNAFRSARDVTHREKTAMLQLRCGRWIANGLRHKWKLAPSPRCPHCASQCGAYDCGWHTAAGCQHPTLGGMATFRHDKAVHMIVDKVLKAHHEQPFQLLVSAGRRYQESTAPITKTIPEWALPGCTLTPDLVLILGLAEGAPPPPRPTPSITFVIADLAVGHGRTSTARITRKQTKYASLIRDLRQRGWSAHAAAQGTCAPELTDDDQDAEIPAAAGTPLPPAAPRAPRNTDIFVASLGAAGELYESTVHTLRALGIDKPAITTLLAALHLHLIRSTSNILSTRRKLDALLQQQPVQPASARTGQG